MSIKVFSILALFATFGSVFGQTQIGLRADNFAGIHAAALNPASTAFSPISWDVSLVGGTFFAENNYIFVENATVGKVIGAPQIISRPDQEGNVAPTGALFSDFRASFKSKYGAVHTSVLGPSVMIHLPQGIAFGVTTAMRFSATTRNFPASYSHYEHTIIPYDSVFTVTKMQFALAAWSEIGLNGSYKFEIGDGFASVGANVKWLGGYQGGFLNFNLDSKFMKREPDTLRIYRPSEANVGITDDIVTNQGVSTARNGSGVGLDMGFVLSSEEDEGDYLWKVGVSLLDIGRIRYKNNAIQHHYALTDRDSITLYEGNYNQYTGIDAYSSIVKQSSYDVFGDSLQSLVDDKFSIALPMRLALQGEYRVMKNVYIHGVWTQRLSQLFTPNTVGLLTAENMVAITPRYERRWLMISMPMELYNYSRPRIGLAARIGPLTIGSDKLGSWLVPNALTGTDFYAAVRIYPFWPKRERADNNGQRGGGGGNGKAYRLPRGRMRKCYEF